MAHGVLLSSNPPLVGWRTIGPHGPLVNSDRSRTESSERRIFAHCRVCKARARADHRALEKPASPVDPAVGRCETSEPACCTRPVATTVLTSEWVMVFISYMKIWFLVVRDCASIVRLNGL